MVASIDGHLPFLAACHCSSLLLLGFTITMVKTIVFVSISITAARPAYAGTEGCYILRLFFSFSFYLTNLRKNGRTLFGAKYGRM